MIATQIKNCSKEEAIVDYKKLHAKTKSLSLKGSKFVDYFTFHERLNTKGWQGISFLDFLESKEKHLEKPYNQKFLQTLEKDSPKLNEMQRLYKLFSLYYGSVAQFKPALAINIYMQFKPNSILDFTMGWGGRLVGACALKVPNYIGIDSNENLKEPYGEMVKTLEEIGIETNIKLFFEDARKIDYSQLDYDCVFTSPPYYNKEIYSGTKRMNKKEWNETFYKPLFKETYLHLKQGGHYVLNVSKAVYESVCIDLLGHADLLMPLAGENRRHLGYKECVYVWHKPHLSNF